MNNNIPREKPSLWEIIYEFPKRLLGKTDEQNNIKDALEEVLDDGGISDSDFSVEEKDMIRNILLVGDVTVQDVMLPRADIIAAEYDITLSELKETIIKERHTRMPIYGENLDDIKGFIHLKDLVSMFAGDEAFDMDKALRQVMFVSPSMKVVDLMVQMRLSAEHLAIVVDEYGGTDGLVTLEDLFEEIVGEIQDEHDFADEKAEIKRLSPSVFEVDARYRLDDLAEEVGVEFVKNQDDEDVDTNGGLVILKLGRIPARGEILEI